MRLQGGLPPAGTVTGPVVEVACDESGFSGTNLLDPATPVITHASVDLSPGEAVTLLASLREEFHFTPYEMKSGPFLRNPHAEQALDRLLTALAGRAHVHVVDKEFFLARRIVDLFLAEPTWLAGTSLATSQLPAAQALYARRDSPGWRPFLAAFAAMTRLKHRTRPDPADIDRFFSVFDAGLDRAHVEEVLSRLSADDPSIPPPLEPLLPALAETVLFWSAGHRQVLVTHDEQSALTAARLTRLQTALASTQLPPSGASGASLPSGATLSTGASLPVGGSRLSPLAGVTVVDSRDDPRVQVADLLAGVARRRPDVRGLGTLPADD